MDTLWKSGKRLRNTHILVIDDQADQRELIRQVFRQAFPQAQVTLVGNEQEVIQYLKSGQQQPQTLPHIILMDLLLPTHHQGWQLLKAIQSMPFPINQIPVILLSQSNDSQLIREAYHRGGNAYVIKPLDFQEWLTYVSILKEYWWGTVSMPQRLFH